MSSRLIVIEDDEARFRDALHDLKRAGWQLHPGWETDGESRDPASHGLACFGRLRTRKDAEAALIAALQGHSIVVHVPTADDAATFVDDLSRIGHVEIRATQELNDSLDRDQLPELLRLLAEGRTIADASRELHLSLRTAQRRLTRARAALGARSTAEAVHIARSRGAVLIGRAAELEVCLQRVADARPLALLGEAGIGKTALLEETAAKCGRRTYIGRALGTLSWVSYLSLEGALGVRLPAGDHASIASAVQRRVGDGVLIVDDLQWTDEDTLKVIPYLAGRIRVLAAVRTGDPGEARARSALEDARFECQQLQPLSADESEALLRERRPNLTLLPIRDIVRRSGGNPLLLEELSWDGKPSNSLQVSVSARLERLSPSTRRALGVLALLGRPGRRSMTGVGLKELARSGLVIETSDGFTPRHALLAEAAAERLTARERRRIHALIASKTPDPGEAAVHHELAGNTEAARREALRGAEAAQHIGQRARLLLIAARTGGDEPNDDALRLRAADTLVQAGGYEDAYRIASAVRSTAPERVAEALLYRARALRGSEGLAAARGLVRKGLSMVTGSGSLVEIRLRLEDISISLWEWDPASVPAARYINELATGTVEESSALFALGAALSMDGSVESLGYLRRAVEGAQRSGDTRAECDAAFSLVSAMKFFRQWRESLRLAAEMRLRTIAAGLRGWEMHFAWHEMYTLIDCAGDLERGIKIGLELLEDPATPSRLVQDVAGVLAVALLEAGRIDDARDVLERTIPHGAQESVAPAIALAELEFAVGNPTRAIAIVDDAVARFSQDPNLIMPWVTRGWACLALDREVEPFPVPYHALMTPYRTELEALIALRVGDPAAAERSFVEASRQFRDLEMRAELRCLWAAGEAAARAGAVTRARSYLLKAEAQAQEHSMKRLLARTHTSMRTIGIRRSASRSQQDRGLTGREREVLDLVAKGHRSRDIASRLGIAPSTVDSLVKSAMTKLDAKTRIEAAERYVTHGAPAM